MKEETNNEMDLLLRRLGRRHDTSVSEANGDVDHLDADELNAYAENVLPPAARARYTEHLAECGRCRELVVQLSSSAAVVPAVATVKAPEPSALRKFLASLFSPLVLRYAVPALGLIVVAAIGFFVLRQDKNHEGEIAQTAEAPKPGGVLTQEAQAQQSPNYAYDQAKPQTPAKPVGSAGSSGDQVAAAAAPKPAPSPATVNGTVVDSLAKKEAEPAEPVTANAPAAAPSKPEATAESREQQAKTEARDEAAQAKVSSAPAAGKNEEEARAKPKDRKAADVVSPRFSGLTAMPSSATGASKQRADEDNKDKDNAENRTVAGRHFRKRGGVWIDTAFNSSHSATNLTRGSEQYRALIADEPAIKTIADQLDGEILVVWKGRPYHIQ